MKLAINSLRCTIHSVQKQNKKKNYVSASTRQEVRASDRKQNGEKAKEERVVEAAAELSRVLFK